MSKVITSDQTSVSKRADGAEVKVDLTTCIGAGPCAIMASLTFGIRDSDGKAIIIDPDGDNFQTVLDAARSCPVNAIILKDKNGKQIYPK